MKLAFSWDDGALEDQKLFELHKKYKLPGMFFVPTSNCEGRKVLSPEMIKNAESEFVSFGGHTENHVYLTSIPIEGVESEVLQNKEYLENVLGHEIDDFCLPGGKYNTDIVEIVLRYFKTIRTADTMNFTYSEGILKPSIHFFPRGYKSLIGNCIRNMSFHELVFLLKHYNSGYFETINDLVEFEKNKPNSVVVIWGHSWEIEKYNLWEELENLMKTVDASMVCQYKDIFSMREDIK